MSSFDLTRRQHRMIADWYQTDEVRQVFSKEALVALVYDTSSGIGTKVTITVKSGDTILSKDITDFESW
jgi:hypothetical protein